MARFEEDAMYPMIHTIARLHQAELRRQTEHRRRVRAVRVARWDRQWLDWRARWAQRRTKPVVVSDDGCGYAACSHSA